MKEIDNRYLLFFFFQGNLLLLPKGFDDNIDVSNEVRYFNCMFVTLILSAFVSSLMTNPFH